MYPIIYAHYISHYSMLTMAHVSVSNSLASASSVRPGCQVRPTKGGPVQAKGQGESCV